MKITGHTILVVNAGSSSIRFAVYDANDPRLRLLNGKVDRIGMTGANLMFDDSAGKSKVLRGPKSGNEGLALSLLLDWLERQPVFASVKAVGHRLVHGMKHSEPERVTSKLLAELHRITPYDPDHLPREIALIEALRKRHPGLAQVACFDTAFHRGMPKIARLLPIPRRYWARGIERYRFHGLSYTYLMEEVPKA